MNKADSLQIIKVLGVNHQDFKVFYSYMDALEFLSTKCQWGLISIRTCALSGSLCNTPYFKNMGRTEAMIRLKSIKDGYIIIVCESIDVKHNKIIGKASLSGKSIYLEYKYAKNETVRDFDNSVSSEIKKIRYSLNHPNISIFFKRSYIKSLLIDLRKLHIYFVNSPQEEYIVDFTIHDINVGINKKKHCLWEVARV